MINCPKCKAEITKDSWYCDQCGQEIKYCSSCGKIGKGHWCTSCGEIMVAANERKKDANVIFHPGKGGIIVNVDSVKKNVRASKIDRLFLINNSLGIQIEAVNGAVIGRNEGIYRAVFSDQSYVSRSHAMLKYDKSLGWSIIDMNSSNGTFVNGTKLTANIPSTINNGALVQLGNIELMVELRK